MPASTRDVLESHLTNMGKSVDDVMTDYNEASVVISPDATVRGMEEIRGFFADFLKKLPPGFQKVFKVTRKEVVDEVAYIVWHAEPYVPYGTDTFVVRDGKIAYQTFAVHSPLRTIVDEVEKLVGR